MSWIRTRIECLLAEGRRRSRWTAAAAVLAALVVVGVVAALSQGATAQTTGTANPSKGKLTSATFSVSRNGHVERLGQNESVAAGTRVQFALTFDFGSNTFSSGDSTVTYTLPEGLVADTVESGEIKGDSSHPDQADKVLGTYSIKDGVVTMTFNEDQVSGLFSEGITTTVTFWAEAQNSSLTDKRNIEFPGTGTLVVDPTEPQLAVSKGSSKVQKVDQWGTNQGDLADGDGNRNRHVTYTIEVGSSTGTGSTVTITDAFAGGSNVAADSYDSDTFQLMRYTSADDTTGTAVDITGKLTTGQTTDSHATFTLAGLDALNAGERYVLTYKATVTEENHTADTSEKNNVTVKTDNDRVSKTAEATTQWGNTGDIYISKSGQLLDDVVDADNPKKKRIQYKVKVWTTKGTVTRIQIGDTVNNNGTNIDTSEWNATNSPNLFFDHDSFHLTKYESKTDADNETNGTSVDQYIDRSTLSFGQDSGRPSMGLSLSEPLQAGEAYILTYTATVTEIDDNAADTRVNNQARARIYPGGAERATNQVNAGVEWHNEIAKSGTFNQDTGYIDWNITVNRNFGSAQGIAINDTLPEGARLVSNVRVYTSDRSGGNKSLVQTIDLLNAANNSVATQGYDDDPSTYNTSTRALHVVLGSWASVKQPYTISFSTTAPADGTVSNQASEVIRDGGTYGTGAVGATINRTTDWGIAKTVGTNAADNYDTATGTYTFAWNATVTFPDENLSPDGANGVVKLHDVFGEVQDENGASSSEYSGLHYAVAMDLYAELTGRSTSGTTVTLRLHNDADANGNPRTYTLSNGTFSWTGDGQTVTLQGVSVVPTFYDANNKVIDNPSTSDAHVKSFDLVLTCDSDKTINGQSLTITGYHSILDARTLPASTQVQAGNSLSSNHTSGSSGQSQSVTTMSNPMEKQVRTLVGRADNNDSLFAQRTTFEAGWASLVTGEDYDTMSGNQHAAQFRIALNTVTYPDDAVVTITDTLPVGMKLATSVSDGTTTPVPHPIRLVYGTNAGQDNASYTAKATLSGSTTSDKWLSYTTTTNESGQQVITFTVDMSKTFNGEKLQKGQYYITYTASFVDDAAWDNPATAHRSYTNMASAQVGAVTYTDDATLEIDRKVSPVQKSQNGTLQNDRKGRYKIIINPAASDLAADSDTVELTDELSGWNTGSNAGVMNPVLDLNSVHLYSYDPNNTNDLGVEVPKASYSLKYEATDSVRKITVTVPDSTALVLVYDYEFRATATGDWGTQQNGAGDYSTTVTNQASLAGATSAQVSEEVRRASSEASGSSRGLYLYKVDSDNYANTLSGSEFDLYSAASQATVWTKVDAAEGKPYTGGYVDNGGTFQPYIDDLTTGNNGVRQHDVLYAFVETKAPTGYGRTVRYLVWLNTGETEDQAWTAITGSDEAQASAKAPKLNVDGQATSEVVSRSDVTFVPYNGAALYIEDEYQSITVTKNWSNTSGALMDTTDGDLPNSIKLQLKQSNDNGTTWVDYGSAITISKPSSDSETWQHTWENLPQSSGSTTYLYKVEEVDASASWSATYLNNGGISSGNITITNTRQYHLPQTGGVPIGAVLGMGTALVAGTAIVLAIRRVSR